MRPCIRGGVQLFREAQSDRNVQVAVGPALEPRWLQVSLRLAKSEGPTLALSLGTKPTPLGRTLYPTDYLVKDIAAAGPENAMVYNLVEVQAVTLKLAVSSTLRCPLVAVSIVIAAMCGLDGLNDPAAQPIPEAVGR